MTFHLSRPNTDAARAKAELLAANTTPEEAAVFIETLREEHGLFGTELGRSEILEVVDEFISIHPHLAPFRWSLFGSVAKSVRGSTAGTIRREMHEVARGHLVRTARSTLNPVLHPSTDYTFKVIYSALRDRGARSAWRASSSICEFDTLEEARDFAFSKLGLTAGEIFPELCNDDLRAVPVVNYDIEVLHASGATVMVLESEEVADIITAQNLTAYTGEGKVDEIIDRIGNPEDARRIVEALTQKHHLDNSAEEANLSS